MDDAMKHEMITRVGGAPDWTQIPTIAIDTKFKPDAAKIRASAQICYDDTALYLHLSAEETDIRANFYQCGDKTAIPHYYCWEMPADRPHGFHCPILTIRHSRIGCGTAEPTE